MEDDVEEVEKRSQWHIEARDRVNHMLTYSQPALPSSSQPLAPPPRTSSREPSINDETTGKSSGGQNLGVPGQSSDKSDAAAAAGGKAPSEKAESIGRRSMRSLTGRKRDASRTSKKSAQQGTGDEKTRPASSGQANAATQQRPKKKGGFLAFLNCCGSSDTGELGQDQPSQPAKPAEKAQQTKVQQPSSQRPAEPASTAATSADDSKEVINEKVAQPEAPAAAPILPQTSGDASADKPVPAGDAPPVQPNAEVRPTESTREMNAKEPITGAPHVESSTAERDAQTGVPPVAGYDASEQDEEPVLDRTPEQAQRDHEIEMSNAGPSLPLSEKDAQEVVDEENQAYERRASSEMNRSDLPPPPPVQAPQDRSEEQPPSQDTAMMTAPEPPQKWLLPPLRPEFNGRKCLVLDLDETLVHSSFKVGLLSMLPSCSFANLLQILHQADFTIPVEIEGQTHNVYVIKRPGVDTFLKRVGELYEVVVFTASVSKYGDPLLDQLDIHHVVHHRLFRESCYNHQGNYVKDLSQVGRDLRETIIIDNSPTSYIFHPQHAVPISSWFSDAHDNELLDLIPVLEDLAGSQVSDVSLVLDVAL